MAATAAGPERKAVAMSGDIRARTVADLRHRRRETRRELARVRWWRQLVRARRQLSVASLAAPTPVGEVGLDSTWEALAADAPTPRELAAAVWPERSPVGAGTIEALDALDARLESYEARVSENLDTVTAQMVEAMAEAERMRVPERERDSA